ncbi:MAG TPA: hypothetical protein VE987_02265 [Polyangiaceae bacterium]|nr:hypothetical protein [Polyangiaceae bacterium]
MFAVVLILALGGLLLTLSVRLQGDEVDQRVTGVVLLSYIARLAIAPITHTANLFSSGAGIDSSAYEAVGEIIARLWQYTGVHYVSGDELEGLDQVNLPQNLFACVIYLNGGPSHFACVAVIAALAAFVCLDMYLICLELGARRDVALKVTTLISLLPSYFYYTSDTYKDGLVTFFVLGILACSVRLSRKFSMLQLAWALLMLLGLWHTRYYLVFVMPALLLLGVLGLRSASLMRTLLAALILVASVAVLYAYSDAPTVVTEHAVKTFQVGTSQNVLNANADSGSGVSFEAGPSALPLKLAYTLFSPFPWQSGSIGLHLAKIEVLVWYYFFYRALSAGRYLWRERRSDLMLFVTFIVPMTVAYALSFANIGLIVRERIGIVLATIVLATVSWSAPEEVAARGRVGAPASARPSIYKARRGPAPRLG